MTEEILSELHRRFVVDIDAGTLIRRFDNKTGKAGQMPKAKASAGYLQVAILRKKYYVHRLIWLAAHGSWPTKELDHIDRNKVNNSIHNLREVDRAQNQRNIGTPRNNTSGHVGVGWHKQSKKWWAKIMVKNKLHSLGLYDQLEDAVAARKAAESLHFSKTSQE